MEFPLSDRGSGGLEAVDVAEVLVEGLVDGINIVSGIVDGVTVVVGVVTQVAALCTEFLILPRPAKSVAKK